jgi:hypothetical protein
MADSCPACGKPTRVTLTRGDLRLLLDPTPSDEGTVVIERHGDGAIRGRILTGDSPEAPGDTVVAYCRHRCNQPDTRPSCRACELPMGRIGNAGDAELVRAERWIDHPHCDLPAAAARARHAARQAAPAAVQDQLPEAS